MLNRICLIGRLTRDVELRATNSGTEVASFTLAVDRKFKNKDGSKETDFINIVAWKQLGELCAKYLSKGKMAAVEGRLQIRDYTDKEGHKRTVAEVIADDVNFLSPKSETTDSDPAGFNKPDNDKEAIDINDENCPF